MRNQISRTIKSLINDILLRDKSILLLGPRQTGKTTLIKTIPSSLSINLILPKTRLGYEKDATKLIAEVEALTMSKNELPLIIIDEVQKIPSIMDSVQALIDDKKAKFILTGSSARKLRRDGDINLLPGRVIPLRLDPLTLNEIPSEYKNLDNLLIYGSLPEIILTKDDKFKEIMLDGYVTIYLEEEVRSEALVRNIGTFARFLELAASESGQIVNFSKLSQEIGVSHTTIAGYYQILEDCLIVERIEPIIKSKTRRKLIKSQRYIFYDLGVRRLAAAEGRKLPRETLASLFEQFIALELIRLARFKLDRIKIQFWHDASSGAEVDWVIMRDHEFIPIEVKYRDYPKAQDLKHLLTFMDEYSCKIGYVVCRCERKMKLAANVFAIPWQEIEYIFDDV